MHGQADIKLVMEWFKLKDGNVIFVDHNNER